MSISFTNKRLARCVCIYIYVCVYFSSITKNEDVSGEIIEPGEKIGIVGTCSRPAIRGPSKNHRLILSQRWRA